MSKLFLLNDGMNIDLIAMWGEYLVFNDIRPISNAVMYSKIAEQMNEKYN